MKRLAIISSHPIQYNAPLFALLAKTEGLTIKVFYTWGKAVLENKFDPGFGKAITWDIPLLEGYDYSFAENISTNPGTHHFNGINTPHLNKDIEAWKPDVLLIFGWSFKSHLSCLRYFHKRVPIIFRGDSTLLDSKGGFTSVLRKIFLKWVYRHIDYALYVGENNKAYFVAFGLLQHQLFRAPHATDNNRFAEPDLEYSHKAIAKRKLLGITERDVVILFAGKLEQKKNPGMVVQLAAAVKNTSVHFLIVGNGMLEEELKSNAATNKRIHFMDFENQQAMPVIYRMGDIFLLPSKGPSETWGLAVNEAMACGRPVMVSSKAGCAPDLVADGINGIIFNPDDVETCVRFIEMMVADGNKRTAYGKASKELIKDFSFKKIHDGILKIPAMQN